MAEMKKELTAMIAEMAATTAAEALEEVMAAADVTGNAGTME